MGIWIFTKTWYADNTDTGREKGCSFFSPGLVGYMVSGPSGLSKESPLRIKPVPEPTGTGKRDRICWHYLRPWVQPWLKPKSTFKLSMQEPILFLMSYLPFFDLQLRESWLLILENQIGQERSPGSVTMTRVGAGKKDVQKTGNCEVFMRWSGAVDSCLEPGQA